MAIVYPPIASPSVSAGGGMTPTEILSTETFTIPERRQALFAEPILNDGILIIDGVLAAVD